MVVNFRYRSKKVDQSIRGILFEAKRWLETEIRIPLEEAEEKLLDIEVATKDGFEKLEATIVREAEAGGHLFQAIAGRAERLGEKIVEDVALGAENAIEGAEKVLSKAEKKAKDKADAEAKRLAEEALDEKSEEAPPETDPEGEDAPPAGEDDPSA